MANITASPLTDPRFQPGTIMLSLSKPKPHEAIPGLMTHDRFVTAGELVAQSEAVLKDMNCPEFECSAYEAAEYLSYNQIWDTETPKFQISSDWQFRAMAERGRCEGYTLRLIAFNTETKQYDSFCVVKYLSCEDTVWKIARKVQDALEEGLYC